MRLALVGVPNSGKTALFNRLTGSRQKVANYAGVTVERKEGSFVGPARQRLYNVLDLPGAYSLTPTTLDEAITRDFLLGRLAGRAAARVHRLRRRRDQPAAQPATRARAARPRRADGRRAQHERPRREPRLSSSIAHVLERELGVPVVDHRRRRARRRCVSSSSSSRACRTRARTRPAAVATNRSFDEIEATQREVRRILKAVGYAEPLRMQCAGAARCAGHASGRRAP